MFSTKYKNIDFVSIRQQKREAQITLCRTVLSYISEFWAADELTCV